MRVDTASDAAFEWEVVPLEFSLDGSRIARLDIRVGPDGVDRAPVASVLVPLVANRVSVARFPGPPTFDVAVRVLAVDQGCARLSVTLLTRGVSS